MTNLPEPIQINSNTLERLSRITGVTVLSYDPPIIDVVTDEGHVRGYDGDSLVMCSSGSMAVKEKD